MPKLNKYWICQPFIQKWLRDIWYIRVFVKQGAPGTFAYEIYLWNFDNQVGNHQRIGHIQSYYTYEEALKFGLEEAQLYCTKERKKLIKNNRYDRRN